MLGMPESSATGVEAAATIVITTVSSSDQSLQLLFCFLFWAAFCTLASTVY